MICVEIASQCCSDIGLQKVSLRAIISAHYCAAANFKDRSDYYYVP